MLAGAAPAAAQETDREPDPLYLGIDNVADKAYERVFTDAREPGRSYNITVSYAFGGD